MLARYRIVRGRRPPGDPLPEGTRQDTRKHTRHVLHPEPELVEDFLKDATEPKRWAAFKKGYQRLLAKRFAADRAPFEALAEAARTGDVHIGCACPTLRQPDVHHCHTVLALRFMQARFKDLDVRVPDR
ncbi:MAG: hypothetical protein AAF721_07115 [Myxococcota bacterium]